MKPEIYIDFGRDDGERAARWAAEMSDELYWQHVAADGGAAHMKHVLSDEAKGLMKVVNRVMRRNP